MIFSENTWSSTLAKQSLLVSALVREARPKVSILIMMSFALKALVDGIEIKSHGRCDTIPDMSAYLL
jgi:hypothetical protein